MEYKALAFLEEVAATIELSFDDTDGTLDVVMKNSDGEQVAADTVTIKTKSLYVHHLTCSLHGEYNGQDDEATVCVSILNNDSTEFTFSSLANFLYSNNFRDTDKWYGATGVRKVDGITTIGRSAIFGLRSSNEKTIVSVSSFNEGGASVTNGTYINGEVTDNCIKLL